MAEPHTQSSSIREILVLGVGELGLPVVEALTSHNLQGSGSKDQQFRLTVARSGSARREALNDHITSLGARLIHKDIAGSSEEELANLFSGYETIIGCSGFGSQLNVQLKLAKAFVASKARTYLPWQFGIDYDIIGRGSALELFDEQLTVREFLREKIGDAVPLTSNEQAHKRRWVIISTGMFASFIVVPAFGVITDPSGTGQHYQVRALNSEDTKVTLTSVEDIARSVVHVVLVDLSIIGVVFIAGETLTYGEVADAVQTATKKPVTKQAWPLEELEADVAAKVDQGKGHEALLEKYRVVFGSGVGTSWPKEETLNYKAGIPMTGFMEWLRDKWLPTQSLSSAD